MNTYKRRIGPLLVLFLLLCLSLSSHGQERTKASPPPLNYGFVSPNTRDDLKLDEAIKGMNSPAEQQLINKARNLGCVVKTKIRAFNALGSWSDGAEYSVMVRMKSDEPSLRYVLSRMGRDSKQKSVLYFYPQGGGTAQLYVLQPRQNLRNLRMIANTLERVGISFRTLVPTGKNTWIYLVDLNNELTEKVKAAARRLRARVKVEKGNASFVGAEQAIEATGVFDRHIKDYEATHPNLPPTCDVRPNRSRLERR